MYQVAQIAYNGHQVIRYSIFANNVEEATPKIKAYIEDASRNIKNARTTILSQSDIRIEFDIVTNVTMPVHITRVLTLIDM